MTKTTSLPARRPAETAGVGGVAVGGLAYLLGVPIETAAAILGVAGLAPAVVTWIVNRGGVRGVARMFWAGRG